MNFERETRLKIGIFASTKGDKSRHTLESAYLAAKTGDCLVKLMNSLYYDCELMKDKKNCRFHQNLKPDF